MEKEIEAPFFDKNGKEIKEFSVLKVFHFKGVNEQGRGRKNYYMYKWVILKELNDKLCYFAKHLHSDRGQHGYYLKSVALMKSRILPDSEIVQ